MPVFNNAEGRLVEITEIPFNLEKNLQTLVEENMKTIFGIDFIEKEFVLKGLRIDSLGFDMDSNAFVIIEYKREKNSSVIDQGYAYLSLLLNNKAEFILAYNENSKESIKKDDVDWSQSRVVFISPSFTSYQKQAIEFRDLPMELWEVRQYSNKTIMFNQIQSTTKSESITKIGHKSKLVSSVSKEVRAYSEDHHLENVPSHVKELFDEFKNQILAIDPNIRIKPRKHYIAFIHKSNFVDFSFQKSGLILYINMKSGSLNDPKNLARDVSKVGTWGNGDYDLRVKNSENIGYIMSLIRQSFDRN